MHTPTLLVGPPGCGKSEIARARAAEMKMAYLPIHLALSDPSEIAGAMVPNATTKRLEHFPPDWWMTACEAPAVIVLEELTAADPDRRVAGLRCADDTRQIGQYRLHSRTEVWATCNPPEYAAGAAAPLSAPELNRWRHLTVTPLAAVRWLAGQPGLVGEVGRYLGANLSAAVASSEAMMQAVDRQTPFASPRSWHRAAGSGLPISEWHTIVGSDAIPGWVAWRDSIRLPDPVEILAGRCKDVPERGDMVLATAMSVVSLASTVEADDAAIEWFDLAAERGYAGTIAAELGRLGEKRDSVIEALRAGKLARYAAMLGVTK